MEAGCPPVPSSVDPSPRTFGAGAGPGGRYPESTSGAEAPESLHELEEQPDHQSEKGNALDESSEDNPGRLD